MADGCWTDPPYGVSYTGKTADALTIANDGAADLPDFIKRAFLAINTALKPGAFIYVAYPSGNLQRIFINEFDEIWGVRQQLIWVKNCFALGHSDYHYRHEPILFGYKPGSFGRAGRGGDNWYGDNAQDSVFEVDKPSRNADHPTMKPIELIVRMLQNSASPNALLIEPFLGSGSTLIAAQTMPGQRTVYGFELSPQYCEVVCRRWEALSGGIAELTGSI
jgi:DNA modification methylase